MDKWDRDKKNVFFILSFLLFSFVLGCSHSGSMQILTPDSHYHNSCSHWQSVDGVNIHYYDTGPGESYAPCLLIVHGWLGSAYHFNEFIGNIPWDVRTIVPDLPGFGLSEKPDEVCSMEYYVEFLREFTRITGLEELNLLGTSMGANIVAHYAARYPGGIDKIILADPFGLKGQKTMLAFLARRQWLVSRKAYRIERKDVSRVLENFVLKDPGMLTDEIIDSYARVFSTPEGRKAVVEVTIHIFGSCYMDKVLPSISHPVLIIAGKEDRLLDQKCLDRYLHLLGCCTLHVIEDCGHMPFVEKPGETAIVVASFLKERTVEQ